jgi:di/tricarboxylate transporter
MRTDQMLIVALIGVMMAAFVWGRFRYDLVAAGALVIALILAAAFLIILTGSLPLREAYNALDAPILAMLAGPHSDQRCAAQDG